MSLASYGRLMRAGFVLAREGAFSLISAQALPPAARPFVALARLIERPSVRKTGRVERLTQALNRLGPTYVKFGQTLATRPDIVGVDIAQDLSALQDQMAPFAEKLVAPILDDELGARAQDLNAITAPIAAASIAQVHAAELVGQDGTRRKVAVKILRPNIETRFAADLESFAAAATWAERLFVDLRRLKPLAAVNILKRSAKFELDLRFEAAAISEFSELLGDDSAFILPQVDWDHSSARVLTTSWLDGIALHNLQALDAAGLDRKKLAATLLDGFLRHAIGGGFFHADMHPGNLFADPKTSKIMLIDFGIMGRITPKERRFLAEILYGFISRNYRRIAELHIEIGYVPKDQSVDDFAAALRTIGEPMHGRTAKDISMAKVLGQLLAVTELFNMHTRPELILLQKNMVLVEGVARMLDPELDIWTVSKPFVSQWVREDAGPKGRLLAAGEHLERAAAAVGQLPDLVTRAQNLMAAHERELKKHQDGTAHRWWMALGAIAFFAVLIYALST